MPSFSYITGIPLATNSPSTDQPNMQTNTNSINSIIGVDHYSFGSAGSKDGFHKQVTLPVESLPASLSGQAVLFSNTSGQSQLFATSDTGGNSYQLTRMIDASFSRFANDTNYQVGPPILFGGWTFLPGGLILNYGSVTNPGNSGTVTYALAFPSGQPAFAITLTLQRASGDQSVTVQTGTSASSGFNFLSSSSGSAFLYWMAIGN